MYKRILVPLDINKQEEAILSHVENLSLHYNAKVVFLNIGEEALMLGWDEVIDVPLYLKKREQQKNKAESYLTNLQRKFSEKGIETQTRITYGSILKSILNTAEETDADLIAMTTHSMNGHSNRFYENILACLLERTNRPFLIVHEDGD